jgi:hypothetical protein
MDIFYDTIFPSTTIGLPEGADFGNNARNCLFATATLLWTAKKSLLENHGSFV